MGYWIPIAGAKGCLPGKSGKLFLITKSERWQKNRFLTYSTTAKSLPRKASKDLDLLSPYHKPTQVGKCENTKVNE